jgi:predicted nuclease of restriction endonuclease-like (RecB) superfamily
MSSTKRPSRSPAERAPTAAKSDGRPSAGGGEGYASALAEAKAAIQAARTRAVLAVNSELIGLYWDLGQLITTRQQAQGWGAKVIDRLSQDLRHEFPEMTGLSPRNLRYMPDFAQAWSDPQIVQRLVAKLPWGHNVTLLDKLRDDQDLRAWYASQAVEYGWSRAVLEHQIMSGLHRRVGAAASNFLQRCVGPSTGCDRC